MTDSVRGGTFHPTICCRFRIITEILGTHRVVLHSTSCGRFRIMTDLVKKGNIGMVCILPSVAQAGL